MTKSCSYTLQWQPYCTRGHSCVCTPNCAHLLTHLVARRCKDLPPLPPQPFKIVVKTFAMKNVRYARPWIKFGPNLCILIQSMYFDTIYVFWYNIEAFLQRIPSQKFTEHSEFGDDIRCWVRNTKPVVCVVWFWLNFSTGDWHKLLLTSI